LLVLRAHVWLVATLVPLLVKLLPLKQLLRLLTPPAWIAPYRGIGQDRIVERVAHHLRSPRNMRRRYCLRLSLTLFHFLRLAGYPAVLRIGVYPRTAHSPRTQAHGWVTLHEVALTSPPEGPAAVILVHGQAQATNSARQGLV
jgi:hypothetical protein